ncbi:MAG: hypothetical protein IM591_15550 [Chitinophagaceae bacterium]|jgi:hypothetical protein|nr:hypothetical protein [Chitinophagaceae bacterium]
MIQFSQIILVGPASVAVEMREFIEDTLNNKKISLAELLKYIVEYRRFRIGYSPRDSEYYGPFSKTDLSPKNYSKFEGSYETLLSKIKNSIINDFPYLDEKEYFELVFNKLILNLNFDNDNVTTYVFNKNFFAFEKSNRFNEPIQYDYFISLIFIDQRKSWFITIWYD